MKKRITTALATLLLLALSLPAFVIAQQSSTSQPPAVRRGEPGATAPSARDTRVRRPRVDATEGVESDVAEALP